jgi:hypothetical protein
MVDLSRSISCSLRVGSQRYPWLPTKSFSFSNVLGYEPPGLLSTGRLFVKVQENKKEDAQSRSE